VTIVNGHSVPTPIINPFYDIQKHFDIVDVSVEYSHTKPGDDYTRVQLSDSLLAATRANTRSHDGWATTGTESHTFRRAAVPTAPSAAAAAAAPSARGPDDADADAEAEASDLDLENDDAGYEGSAAQLPHGRGRAPLAASTAQRLSAAAAPSPALTPSRVIFRHGASAPSLAQPLRSPPARRRHRQATGAAHTSSLERLPSPAMLQFPEPGEHYPSSDEFGIAPRSGSDANPGAMPTHRLAAGSQARTRVLVAAPSAAEIAAAKRPGAPAGDDAANNKRQKK
jgi:hypothetical protein